MDHQYAGCLFFRAKWHIAILPYCPYCHTSVPSQSCFHGAMGYGPQRRVEYGPQRRLDATRLMYRVTCVTLPGSHPTLLLKTSGSMGLMAGGIIGGMDMMSTYGPPIRFRNGSKHCEIPVCTDGWSAL